MHTHPPLPASLTPFFGRKQELERIAALLRDPACRLLVLSGPGGIGKSRLALEAAHEAQAAFADGACSVELEAVSSGELLPMAILDALGVAHGADDLQVQLSHYLSTRSMLLLLDNFEHLLAAADLLTHLLVHAPRLKLLVTSREALNLQEEWQFPLAGMELPANPRTAQESSAVQLFAACARRARGDFALDAELAPVVEICQAVEGMPLAIELAASWTRMLPCTIIAQEIRANIGFLASNLRNIPARHRSLLAVFEQTWRMLSPVEQQAYRRLAVFRGGFTPQAARAVAQADLPLMLGLLDKSLLRRVAPAQSAAGAQRFGLHETLRQFALEQLAQNEAQARETHASHSAYYLALLRSQTPDLLGGNQAAAVQAVSAELENIRAAWNWAAQNDSADLLQHAVQPLDLFFQYQSRYYEGALLFERTVATLDSTPVTESSSFTQAQLLSCLGWLNIRLGKFDLAQAVLDRANALFDAVTVPPPPGLGADPDSALAILAVVRGDYPAAVRLGESLLRESEARADRYGLASARYALASAGLAQGQYETARQHAQQTCDIAAALGDRWLLAYSTKQLGDCMLGLGKTRPARSYYQKCYQLRQEFKDPEGMALALSHLGKVAMLEEDYPEALRCYQESHAIYSSVYDRGGLAAALNGLGCVALHTGQPEDARQQLRQALQAAAEIQFVPLLLAVLVSVARLYQQTGRAAQALTLLRFVEEHPASEQETRQLAQALRQELPADTPASAGESAKLLLDALVRALLLELETPLAMKVGAQDSTQSAEQPDQSMLVEALTEREIEILRCMSSGLSNQAIADQLVLSLGTVKWYSSQIYGKLQVRSRTQAVAQARKLGLL